MKTDLFQSCGHCWVFQICWHIDCSTFTASSSRIWNSSAGIPSPPLALFLAMLSKAHLTSHSRSLALDEWSHLCDYPGREDLFCTVLLCILATCSYRCYVNTWCGSNNVLCAKIRMHSYWICLSTPEKTDVHNFITIFKQDYKQQDSFTVTSECSLLKEKHAT